MAASSESVLQSVSEWTFDNSFSDQLPADPVVENRRRQVHQAAFSRVSPTPVKAPRLLAHSAEVAEMLDLGPAAVDEALFTEVMAGNTVLDGSDTYAMAYAGHQFGNFAGQLGDGRAIVLGEVATRNHGTQMLQLKGAGPTPYSRTADGLAVLRSSVREFLCSEAMHHLGIPTTRALSLVGTGEEVMRDMFYDGRAALEPGAIVCRVAPTFVRFGSFELPASRGDHELLRKLADHTIRHHFAHLLEGDEPIGPDTYLRWFTEVRDTTAEMIAHWMRVGFVHGVMNTDNMSILGLTIDYGPYGWLDDFDPSWTPNTTDASHRRYRYGNQAQIAHWNLMQLANAIHPLIGETDPLQEALNGFAPTYSERWQQIVRHKFGLIDSSATDGDDAIIDAGFELMMRVETDMTIFFRSLGEIDDLDVAAGDDELAALISDAIYSPDERSADDVAATAAWLRRWWTAVSSNGSSPMQRSEVMETVNPKYVLRNYLAQVAIDKATQGDVAEIHELLDVLRKPYDEQPGRDEYAAKRPEWARHRPGCSTLSCSS